MKQTSLLSIIVQLFNPPNLARICLVTLAYWCSGKICLIYPFIPPNVSLIWLPAGIIVAALLRWGPSMLIAAFIGAFILNYGTGIGSLVSTLIAIGNSLGAYFIYRMMNKNKYSNSFSHNLHIVRFFSVTIIGTGISALIGSMCLWLANTIYSPWAAFYTWLAGDFLGVILIVPFLISITQSQLSALKEIRHEIYVYALIFITVHWLVFLSPFNIMHKAFITMIFVLWSAIRFGSLGSSIVTILSASFALYATYNQYGPFSADNQVHNFVTLWIYMVMLCGTSITVTAMREDRALALIELKESYERIQKVASRLPGVILQYTVLNSKMTTVHYASEAIISLLEVTPEQIRNNSNLLLNCIDPQDIADFKNTLSKAHQSISPYQVSFRYHKKNQDIRWLYIDAIPELINQNESVWHCFISDITDRKIAEDHLRIAAITFESQAGTFIANAKWKIIQVNRAFTEITGYQIEDLFGKFIPRLINEKQDIEFYYQIEQALSKDNFWQGELWTTRKNGETYPQMMTLTCILDENQEVTHFVGTFSDISIHKGYEDEIINLAFYDPLTHLPNRRLLMDRLKQLIALNNREGGHSAIFFIDLDNFKTLNDTHGHDAGDLLLIEVARRLQTCVRESDTVARLGGDEFVIVLNSLSCESHDAMLQADRVGEKIRSILNEPYQIADYTHHGSGSIGVCLFQGNEVTVKDLFKRADTAMYEAKTSGRNALRFFDPAMQAVLVVRMMLESNLRNALALNQFQLHYQIQVDANGKILGAEALLRWIHPDRGFISPLDFIPLAEQTGLIVPIGIWVMETACAQLQEWSENPKTATLSLAVNVSAKQFKQADFVESMISIVSRFNFDISRLKIELTESTILDNVDDTTEKMHLLKKIGVSFSMDDFGTGYSSLAYLQKLPLNQLKIDRSFVQDISNDESDATIVRTIISLGNNLGLHVIAEGVETLGQRQFLIEHDCFAFQGFLYSKPLPITELNSLLLSSKEDHPHFMHESST